MKKEKRARARRTGAQAAESGAARPAGGAGKTLRALGFAQKLTLAMLLVLAMALSLGGAVVLAGNFDDALNEAGQQAEVQHLLQCYALESDLLDVAARGETVTDSHLARYGSSLEDYVGGKLVALTPREFDLLEQLLRNRGAALYRDVLFERVWGGEMDDGTRTLDLHIQRLRKKLGWQEHIKTVYKVGYLLEMEGEP